MVGLLQALLALQETWDDDLALLAKQALAYAKYLPLMAEHLQPAVDILVAASSAGQLAHQSSCSDSTAVLCF